MKYCKNCGTELKENDLFCPNCGTELKEELPETSEEKEKDIFEQNEPEEKENDTFKQNETETKEEVKEEVPEAPEEKEETKEELPETQEEQENNTFEQSEPEEKEEVKEELPEVPEEQENDSFEQNEPEVKEEIKTNELKANNIKKTNKFWEICRYIISILLLTTLTSYNNIVSSILCLLAVALIFPISANFIYKKIGSVKIPSILRVFIPIILIIFAISLMDTEEKQEVENKEPKEEIKENTKENKETEEQERKEEKKEQQETPKQEEKKETQPKNTNKKFNYTVTNEYTDEYGFSHYIEGTVTNNRNKNYSYVQIEFICYDNQGNNLGTAMDNTSNLLANQTWKFKAMAFFSDASNVDHCDFHEINGY